MQDEFLEPLPSKQVDAQLTFASGRVTCHVVAITENGFLVAVPGVERYEGDPRMMLVTAHGKIPVKLTLQEAHKGGYSYRLVRHEPVNHVTIKTESPPSSGKLAPRVACAGLVAVAVAVCISIPTFGGQSPLVALQQGGQNLLRWPFLSSESPISDSSKHPVEQSIVINQRFHKIVPQKTLDLNTISVSMVTPTYSRQTSDSAVSDGPSASNHDGAETRIDARQSHSNAPKKKSLKNVLEEGMVGRIQPATKSMLPWLFVGETPTAKPSMRISDAAWLDLKQFEGGLRGLPEKESAQAISSLRHTLMLASHNYGPSQRVPGMAEVFMMSSDDAQIYFRMINGRMDLVRVLPIEMNESE